MTDPIDKFLDADGRATMTAELWDIFIGAGCKPGCHICQDDIEVGVPFRLKPFATVKKEEGNTTEVAAMVCRECDLAKKKLNHNDAKRVARLAEGLAQYDDLSKTIMKKAMVKPEPPWSGCFLVRDNQNIRIVPAD